LVSTGKVSSESKGKKVKPSAEEKRAEESKKEAAEVKEERQRVVEMEVFGWRLVHELLSQEEQEEVLRRYRTTRPQLPKILTSDPVVRRLGAKPGDIIKITRTSPTAGVTVYYRVVDEA
jgi:DNA-directed RNA polymerase subunit H